MKAFDEFTLPLSPLVAVQRYAAAELPSANAHVSVLTYSIVSPGKRDGCRAFNERTVAVVDIVEAKARETKMVTVGRDSVCWAAPHGQPGRQPD